MNYNELLEKLNNYKNEFQIKEIGTTKFKRKIFAVERILNENFATAIFVGSIHAREYITSDLICKFIDDGLLKNVNNFNLSFIIMANPDGVELACNGLESVPEKYQKRLLKINNNSKNFSLWKANGRAVDINNNFDAKFKSNINSKTFSSAGFAGHKPESELETKAIVKYLKRVNPFIVLCYHSKGEEIYYNFFQDKARLERDKLIAERFARSTGYIIKNPEKMSSGGLKDYVVEKLKIPSLTIEVGSDALSHPIKSESLEAIFEKHKSIANDLDFAYNVFIKFKEKL